MKEKYVLTALDSFSCLADKCPRDCCSRFVVQLDPATHRKWQALATGSDRAWLLDGMLQEGAGEKSKLVITNKPGSADCFFLRPDRLCAIHGRLGEEFLSETCRDYPRHKKMIGNREIMHATLSCPEIARLVLFDDTSPVFRHVQRQGGAASGQQSQSANEQVSCFLDEILTDIFSASAYPLNVRTSYLARLLAEIITLSESKQLSSQVLAKFADKHQANLKGFVEAFSAGRFASRPVNGMHMWDLLRAGAERFHLFQACGLDEHLPIMQLARQAITDNDAKQLFYQELMALRGSASSQLRRYEKVFARYLQCRFMAQGFPLSLQQHPVATFLAAVLPFAMTQMLIWIKTSAGSSLTDQDIVDVVVRVEEILFHSDTLLQTLAKNQLLLNIGGYFDWFLEVG